MQNLLHGARLFAVQMNESEAQHATGTDSIEEAIVHLRHWAGDETLVIITTATCALAWTATHYVKIPACRVSVADTTGCGDGFAAAVLATLLQRAPIQKALENGHRNGASVAKHVGATTGQLDWEALNAFDAEQYAEPQSAGLPAPTKAAIEAPQPARGFAWAIAAAAVFLLALVAWAK